jgi:D-amino peptidase
VCGSFGVPVLLISGDQAVCSEASDWVDGITTVQVKKAVGRHAAECLPLAEAQRRIQIGSAQAIRNFLAGVAPAPVRLANPVSVAVEFLYSDMADRAALYPGALRRDGRKVEVTAPTMPEAYLAFRALVGLAQR